MISTTQLRTKVRSMNPPVASYYNSNEIQKSFCRKDDSFCIMDSTETVFSPTVLFKMKDAVLLYVDKGELTVIHNSKTYTLSGGMLLIKTPNMVLQLLGGSEDCHFKVVAFTPQFGIASCVSIKHLETIALMASSNPVLTLDTLKAATVDVLFSLLEQKESVNEKQELYDETLKHVFSLLILEIVSLIRRNITDSTSGFNRKAHLTFQFLKLLREHIKEQRSVNFYAEMLYVTPKHLSMCVKETTGKTCGETIDEMVVAEAKTLLHNPELTIGHVADELNFSDQYFFSKYFKKRTGMSPMNYRMAV
jgi:AraC family transcriptional regulator, transcriptional activator of pobA